MNRKKLTALIMVLALALTTLVGGTLAYFTDEDDATNTFTMGNVKIELLEEFEQEAAELVPGKDITKAISVRNTGNNEAFVRVHIAIPSNLDDGDPEFAATNNFVHFNFDWESVVYSQWTWFNTDAPKSTPYAEYPGYPGTGNKEWNFYTTTVDEVKYNVYVVTYRSALASGEITGTDAMSNVYLDASVDNKYITDDEGNITKIMFVDNKGNEFELPAVVEDDIVKVDGTALDILVAAEGVQTEGFTTAIEALNKAFGVPGTYNPWA